MKTRVVIVVVLLVGLVTLVDFDLCARRSLARADMERNEAATRLAALTREAQSAAQQIKTVRAHRDTLRKLVVANRGSVSSSPAAAGGANPLDPRAKEAAIADAAELRNLRVRAFVGEQRLKFAAILYQLRLTPEQLQRFDDIQAEYQEAALDLASTARAQGITNPTELAPMRRAMAAAHDAHLQQLFGDNYDAWQDAWRNQGAQATVDEILQQTFQSSGAINADQEQTLVAMVKRHAQHDPVAPYDWNAIAEDAATVFSGPKLDALRTAFTLRTLSEQMNAMGGGHR